MFVAFSVGKWIQETCDELYGLIAERTRQPTYYGKLNFCTDGNEQNENALLKFFNKDCINYGQVIKDKEKQTVFGIHKRKVLGNLSFDKISIAHVDGLCKSLSDFRKELWKFDNQYNNWRKQEILGWNNPASVYNNKKYFNKQRKLLKKRTEIRATN